MVKELEVVRNRVGGYPGAELVGWMEQPVQALTCWAYLRSNRETSVAEVRLERGEESWGKS